MDQYFEQYSIKDIIRYHIELTEDITCLVEGHYFKDKGIKIILIIDFTRVFLVLTTIKIIVLTIILETSVNINFLILLKNIDSIFYEK